MVDDVGYLCSQRRRRVAILEALEVDRTQKLAWCDSCKATRRVVEHRRRLEVVEARILPPDVIRPVPTVRQYHVSAAARAKPVEVAGEFDAQIMLQQGQSEPR